uniref:Uncharacterized protein n=1 Tax=Romanomermis culicivorax TaxID=13658 RepID=A0A915KYB3_ROMCU
MTSSGAGTPDDLPDQKSKNRLFSYAGRRMNTKRIGLTEKTNCNNLSSFFNAKFTSKAFGKLH